MVPQVQKPVLEQASTKQAPYGGSRKEEYFPVA
jgi:hypothetical protein